MPIYQTTEENKGNFIEAEKQTLAFAAASALTSLDHSPSPSDSDDNDNVPMTFPQRLMKILSNEAHSEIITWLPHGKAFIIYKKKKFVNEVLPRYLKQSKYTSFTRKLNRWGFIRVTRGPETGAYYHNYFQRGNMRLCMQMACQTEKPSGNNSMPGMNAVAPASSGPSFYVPPPAYPQKTLQALSLAREVHNNKLKVKQLAAAASLQNQMLLLSSQSPQKPVPSENDAMNPNSEYSFSVVKAAIDALQGPKLSGPSINITNHFMSLSKTSDNLGCTLPAAHKAVRRASAA